MKRTITILSLTLGLSLGLAPSCTCIAPQGPPNDDTSQPADGETGDVEAPAEGAPEAA